MDQIDTDLAAYRARIAENNERQALKERSEFLYQRKVAFGQDIRDSTDPNSGLQPAIGSHDAWPYRPGPGAWSSDPAARPPVYTPQKQRDLAEERRIAEGERFVPRCTGCLARLDPQWCGHIAPDDRDRL